MSRSLRRLMKEATELSTSPSPHFHAQPVSESNLYDWHFTLAGPPAPSPYAGGIYHGRIVLPSAYPLRPPSFRFLTPSGRFEVNREICLSISGHHEETWQPAWGIRTALLAIRSFMEGDARGQVGGLEVSDDARKEYALSSREWRCEACEGAKTNEDILMEWRDICREKGVDVDKEDADELPEGLTLGAPKKESSNSSGDQKSDESAVFSVSTPAPASQPVPAQEPSVPVFESTQGRPTPQDSPQVQPPPQQVQAQTLTPTPTPTTMAQRQPVNRAAPVPAPVASQDTPWLDRAIFGVLVALVLMILRRIASMEDY